MSSMTCCVLIDGMWNTVTSLMWDLIKFTRRASCSFEAMQCGAEILVCSMLIKCSLKAFEIPTGLLICSPFTSIKKNWLVLAWLEQLP